MHRLRSLSARSPDSTFPAAAEGARFDLPAADWRVLAALGGVVDQLNERFGVDWSDYAGGDPALCVDHES